MKKLMNLYKAGDLVAFGKIYEKYAPMFYGYLKKRLPPSEVEDAYQNIWRHLHEKRNHFSDQPFAPWFFHMIKNLLVDQYRSMGRNTRRNTRLLKTMSESSMEKKSINITKLTSLLAELPSDSKELVQKYFIEGFSYEEIEKETGASQISLRKRLSRAIAQLRRKSEEQNEE